MKVQGYKSIVTVAMLKRQLFFTQLYDVAQLLLLVIFDCSSFI